MVDCDRDMWKWVDKECVGLTVKFSQLALGVNEVSLLGTIVYVA